MSFYVSKVTYVLFLNKESHVAFQCDKACGNQYSICQASMSNIISIVTISSAAAAFSRNLGAALRDQLKDANVDIAFDEQYDDISVDRKLMDLLDGIKDEARGEKLVCI